MLMTLLVFQGCRCVRRQNVKLDQCQYLLNQSDFKLCKVIYISVTFVAEKCRHFLFFIFKICMFHCHFSGRLVPNLHVCFYIEKPQLLCGPVLWPGKTEFWQYTTEKIITKDSSPPVAITQWLSELTLREGPSRLCVCVWVFDWYLKDKRKTDKCPATKRRI